MSRFVANFVFNGPRVSRWQEPARPAPRPEPAAAEVMESEDQRTLFDLRVRAKAGTYIGNGMPAGLAWPRAYRALKETFDPNQASKSRILTLCSTPGCLTTTVIVVWPWPI